MANVRQTNHIQERPQRQGGLLGSLFNILQMIPIPEAQMAGKVGSAFLNPTGSNLGGVVSQTAKMIGGGDGSLTDPTDGGPNEEDGPLMSGGGVRSSFVGPTQEEEPGPEPTPVILDGPATDPVTDDPEKKDDTKSLDLYANMTMDEVFKKHPQLQNMFFEYLFQA